MIVILSYYLKWQPIWSYDQTLHMPHVGSIIFMVVLSDWSFTFSGPWVQTKIEELLPAPEHIINPDKLRFLIRLPADWQSPIGPLYSDQADRLHIRHNSCFIFLFDFLHHQSHRVGKVFNINTSHVGFIFFVFTVPLFHRMAIFLVGKSIPFT
jgi:hypothetical protein